MTTQEWIEANRNNAQELTADGFSGDPTAPIWIGQPVINPQKEGNFTHAGQDLIDCGYDVATSCRVFKRGGEAEEPESGPGRFTLTELKRMAWDKVREIATGYAIEIVEGEAKDKVAERIYAAQEVNR